MPLKSPAANRNSGLATQVMNPEKQRYHHGDLRAALLSAAIALIEQSGVKGFSLKDAAALAGVSSAAPYRHFADKAALLDALRTDGFHLFNAALAEAHARGTTPRSAILELGVAYVHFAIANPAHIRVMFGLAGNRLPPPPAVPVDDQGGGFRLLVQAVEALLPIASVQARTDLVVASWSLVHGFAMLHIEGAFAATMQLPDWELQLRRALALILPGTATSQR